MISDKGSQDFDDAGSLACYSRMDALGDRACALVIYVNRRRDRIVHSRININMARFLASRHLACLATGSNRAEAVFSLSNENFD
ncbi:hypothetical protein PATSB16_21500 [Pandoraea thiooxydans]|nr:hypothetical protein PATSB16_21500 [Pandoraea thiooxydans]